MKIERMKLVDLHEAQTSLFRLVDAAARGEQVVITKGVKPIAKLIPLTRLARRPGRLKGKIRMAEDFEAPLPGPLSVAFGAETD